MKKNKLLLLAALAITISSCSSLSSISNGGYSDISLNKNSNEYELKRLDEITSEGNAIFGIPVKAKKKRGVIVRFNGVEFGKSNQIFPIITMLGYTIGLGTLVKDIAGTNDNYEDNLSLPVATIIAIPFAGILNNATWSQAALQNASWNLNSKLVEENKDIDIFLNPKYEISYNQGLFTQSAKVTAKVMGATIKTE